MNLEEPILTEWEAKMLDEIEKYDTIKNSKEEGFEEGESKKQIEIAKNLLKMKMDVNDISKATGLAIDEINLLIKK